MKPLQSLGRESGLSLIELMIVLIILGILAGIALPAYQDNMRKTRRSDAFAMLMDIAGRQAQYQLDRATYTDDMTDLGYAADPVISDDGFYSVDYVACAGVGDNATNCYILVATAVATAGQSSDTLCNRLVLRSDGRKGSVAKGDSFPADEETDGRCW